MAFKKKPSLDVDNVFKLGGVDKKGKACPKQIEGFYVGSRTVEGDQGTSTIHVFQTSKGKVGIWGSKTLNTTLSAEDAGYMIRVTYLGKKKLTKGRTQHMYDIEIDEDQRSEEAAADTEEGEEGLEASDESEDSEDTEDEEEAEEDEEPAAPALAASSAAERKAKVQALVNKRKQA